MPSRIPNTEENNICEDYKNRRLTRNEISIKYGHCRQTIAKILKRNNIPIHKRKGHPIIKCNENYFETIDTPAKAYYLGFIAGDGSICDQESALVINLAVKDEQFLKDFLIALDSDHSIYKRNDFHKKTQKTYEGRSVKIARSKMAEDLTRHGVGSNKSKELSISPTIPVYLIRHFIRGIIDSDGCWSISGNRINCGFLSSVESFSVEVSTILIKECDLRSVKILPRPGCFEIRWTGNSQCKRIYDYLYGDGGPYLQRKYDLSTNHFNSLDAKIS